jgi:large subunit ribosomal protein L29
MKASVRDLSETEIQKRLAEARQELFTLRLKRASGKLTNPARVARVRRTVAQLLTALRAQVHAQAGAQD